MIVCSRNKYPFFNMKKQPQLLLFIFTSMIYKHVMLVKIHIRIKRNTEKSWKSFGRRKSRIERNIFKKSYKNSFPVYSLIPLSGNHYTRK